MSDIAIAEPHKPPAAAKPKYPHGKLRKLIQLMIWEGLSPAEAGLKLNYRGWRKNFNEPHVIAYMLSQCEVLQASERPRSIHRLLEIRDAANNMPAVKAAQIIMGDDNKQHSGLAASASPGVVIRIVNVAPAQPVIDADILRQNIRTNEINTLPDDGSNGS